MRLPEYLAKRFLAEAGVSVPRGVLVESSGVEEFRPEAHGLRFPVVVKAQVLHGGRGKAGLVRIARDVEELRRALRELAAVSLGGRVLVEEYVPHDDELYVALLVDRGRRGVVLLAGEKGGVDVEEAVRAGYRFAFEPVEPFLGLRGFVARRAGKRVGLGGRLLTGFERVALSLYRVMERLDAELVEVNPLAVRGDGSLVALDAKVVVDDNALARHPELGGVDALVELGEYTELEAEARRHGLAFVEIGEGVGVVGNGAGLTMATMDLVVALGGSVASFLDLGGGASAERAARALDILSRHRGTRAVFVNVFGGITRCDEIARGIVEAVRGRGFAKPLVVRLAGNAAEEGRAILAEAGLEAYTDLVEAASAAIRYASGS